MGLSGIPPVALVGTHSMCCLTQNLIFYGADPSFALLQAEFPGIQLKTHSFASEPKDRSVCLLDMQASQEMSPDDSFELVVLGGILGNVEETESGDFTSDDRTSVLRAWEFPETRHLGPLQMTTDTALEVSHLILNEQRPLNSLKFVDSPEFRLGPQETLQMLGFRYLDRDGPVIPDGMLDYWKADDF